MKNLELNMMNRNVFSEESKFKEPCQTFVLQGVVCPSCGSARTIDFCRDNALFREDGEPNWICPSCSSEIDHLEIEDALYEEIKRLVENFYVFV